MSNEKLLAAIRDAARSTGYVTNGQSYEVAEAVAAALSASEGAAPVAAYLIRARFPDGIEVYLDVNGVHDLGDKTGIDVSMPDYCKSPVHEHTATAPQPAVNGAGLSDAEIDTLFVKYAQLSESNREYVRANRKLFRTIARAILAAAGELK